MECSPTPEPAYLNLPGWRCVPVYALPYTRAGSKTPSPDNCNPAITAKSLLPTNMPGDPRQWSRQQVYSWLEWCIDNFSLPPLDVEQFYMNGRGLCLLKKTDWRDRAPRSGDILYNALQLLIEGDTENNTGSCNGNNGLVQENVSAALLHHASQHERGSSQYFPTQTWPRSISSDFHNMGHVLRENDQSNGLAASELNGSDVDSTVDTSPAPSPDDITVKGLDAHRLPRNAANQENNLVPDLMPMPSGMPLLKQANGKVNGDNVIEKINVRLLWDFLQQLLNDSQQRYTSCIMWKDKIRGIFKITDPHRLAGLWGKQKNHLNMNFDKMSRALRYYYRVRILQKEPGERHCYRFLRHPNELRHCKQRALLTKDTSAQNLLNSTALQCGDIEAVLDMSIKEEGSSPGDAE